MARHAGRHLLAHLFRAKKTTPPSLRCGHPRPAPPSALRAIRTTFYSRVMSVCPLNFFLNLFHRVAQTNGGSTLLRRRGDVFTAGPRAPALSEQLAHFQLESA